MHHKVQAAGVQLQPRTWPPTTTQPPLSDRITGAKLMPFQPTRFLIARRAAFAIHSIAAAPKTSAAGNGLANGLAGADWAVLGS